MELPFLMAVFRYVFIFPEWKKVYELVTLLTCMVNMLNTNLTRRTFKMKFLWRFVEPGVCLRMCHERFHTVVPPEVLSEVDASSLNNIHFIRPKCILLRSTPVGMSVGYICPSFRAVHSDGIIQLALGRLLWNSVRRICTSICWHIPMPVKFGQNRHLGEYCVNVAYCRADCDVTHPFLKCGGIHHHHHHQ